MPLSSQIKGCESIPLADDKDFSASSENFQNIPHGINGGSEGDGGVRFENEGVHRTPLAIWENEYGL